MNVKQPCLRVKKKKSLNERIINRCLKTIEEAQNPVTKRPTALQTVYHRRNNRRTVYYFTQKKGPGNEAAKDELEGSDAPPFHIPLDIQDFSYRTRFRESHTRLREESRGYQYWNRPSYRTRLCSGKLERLYVPEASIPGKSATENIHPNFYKIVSGRPIPVKHDVHDYIRDLRKLFLTRLEAGYRCDDMYRMLDQYQKEKKRLREIDERFKYYASCYDRFLAEDHSSSIILLKEADTEAKNTKMKNEKIRSLLRVTGWYRGKILVLDEQWRTGKIFQRFLYKVSPLWWRNKYDYLHRVENGELSDTLTQGKSKSLSLSTVHSVVSIIEEFIEESAYAEQPVLYFQNPMELHHIFHEMEKSNLLALHQCEELAPPAQQMVQGLNKARGLFAKELRILREYMNALEEEVIYEENRSQELEQKAKSISFGLFKDLIVDRYTLNLFVDVEDCYEMCVAPSVGNLSLIAMMKGIENKQESLLVALDNLPNDIVLKALASCYKEDAKVFREAQEATKMITQIENLMRTLRKSLEPRRKGTTGRRALWRSDPPKEKMDMVVPMNPLTKEQLEYLHFFTDFCPTKDDVETGKQLYANRIVITKRDY